MTQLEELKAAIIAKVPEIKTDEECWYCVGGKQLFGNQDTCEKCAGSGSRVEYRAITIADVLRAIGKEALLNMDHAAARNGRGVLLIMLERVGTHPRAEWDLTKPLDDQSPDTIAFLHSILCK